MSKIAYELIDTPVSGNGWKVRLLASLLNLPIERKICSMEKDIKTEAYKTINPLQQVPALKTKEGHWLYESTAILWYLAKGTDFLPTDPFLQAQVIQWFMFEQTKLLYPLSRPRKFVHVKKTHAMNDPEIEAMRQEGYIYIQLLEDHLSYNDYLVGTQVSIADITIYAYIKLAPEGGYQLDKYQHLYAWSKRIEALEGYIPLKSS